MLKIYQEISLKNFDFWGGAEDNAALLTDDELEQIEGILEGIEDEQSENSINDLFRFDFETVCEWIDLTEDEVYSRQNDDEYNEEEDETEE